MQTETSLCMGCMNDKTYDGPCKLCGYSDSDPCIPAYLPPKTLLKDRYIVGKLLSYNGEGAVYIGYDTQAGCKITIKEFMPDRLCSREKGNPGISVNANNSPLYKTYMSEFADLNKTLMKLSGTARIQAVLDVFYENNTCYSVFEFISGISLKTYLENSSGELVWEQVKELFPPILTTLSLIHAGGIIHRGISPQTIFVTDKMELKLMGFCISAARTTNTEIDCEIFSGYAAPEQYGSGLNGTWTDVYGISAVLYRALTGTAPVEANKRTDVNMPEPALVNRNVPQNVSRVIMNGMRLSTDTRIRSITEFVDKLFAPPRYSAEGGSAVDSHGRPLTIKEQMVQRKQEKERRKTLAILIGVGALLIAFAIAFALTVSGACTPKHSPSNVFGEDSSTVSESVDNSVSSESAEDSEASEPESSDESSAEANIRVPDFTNRSYEKTVSKYEGILTFVPTYDYSDEYDAGMMFDQSVKADTMVSAGTQIEVKVSKGKSVVALPDYNGKTKDEYVAMLTKLNIRYSLDTERTNDAPDGSVAHCSKEVGDLVSVADGETVTVYIAENYTEESESSSDETDSSDEITDGAEEE